MQEPRAEGATRQALAFAERMINDMADSAKAYWRGWGPLGEPMVQAALHINYKRLQDMVVCSESNYHG